MPLTVYAAKSISSLYGSERELISERENVLVQEPDGLLNGYLFHIVFCSFNQIDLVFNQCNRGREWLANIAPEVDALTSVIKL